jgi:hypothetical protein
VAGGRKYFPFNEGQNVINKEKTGFSWGGVVNVFLRIWKSSF